jgi:hypothetical protein
MPMRGGVGVKFFEKKPGLNTRTGLFYVPLLYGWMLPCEPDHRAAARMFASKKNRGCI